MDESEAPTDSIDPPEEDSTAMFDETEGAMLKMLSPTEESRWMRAAIPHLPRRLAVFYLLLNIGLPGSGTILSGWSTLCVGRSRMANQCLMIVVNTSVGVAQFLTIPWLLVGWFWSIAWGIILWLLAEDDEAHELTTSQTTSPYPSDLSSVGEMSDLKSIKSILSSQNLGSLSSASWLHEITE